MMLPAEADLIPTASNSVLIATDPVIDATDMAMTGSIASRIWLAAFMIRSVGV